MLNKFPRFSIAIVLLIDRKALDYNFVKHDRGRIPQFTNVHYVENSN